MEPYSLESMLGDGFFSLLQSKRGKERKAALDKLLRVMNKEPCFILTPHVLDRLVKELMTILRIGKNTRKSVASALTKLAKACKKDFKPFANSIITECLIHTNEKKKATRDAFIECLDASYDTTTDMAAVLLVIEKALINGTPSTKPYICQFLTSILLKAEPVAIRNLAAFTHPIMDYVCKLTNGQDVSCRDDAIRVQAAFLRAECKKFTPSILHRFVEKDVLNLERLKEQYNRLLTDYPYPPEVIYEEEFESEKKRRRRATIFHSLVSLNIQGSPASELPEREQLTMTFEDAGSAECSSFIEVIECDENGQEKQQVVVTTENPDIAQPDRKDKSNDVQITQQGSESIVLSFGKSKPANLKLPEEESADRQLSSPNVQIKYEKRGGHRKRVIVVKNVDPTLLRTPPVSCFKTSEIDKVEATRKSFRFADTRNEGPLCNVKEFDYLEGARYPMRKATFKKTMFGTVL